TKCPSSDAEIPHLHLDGATPGSRQRSPSCLAHKWGTFLTLTKDCSDRHPVELHRLIPAQSYLLRASGGTIPASSHASHWRESRNNGSGQIRAVKRGAENASRIHGSRATSSWRYCLRRSPCS